MDPFSFPPLTLILDVAVTAFGRLADLIAPVAGDLSTAAAIALVTLLVRAALIPAGIAQARADQTRARLAPRIRALQVRYRADPERLQRETMRLYRDEKASPLAGCLPLLVQAPVVGLVYSAFIRSDVAGHPNPLLAEGMFGVPLSSTLAATLTEGRITLDAALVFGAVILVITAVAEATRRYFRAADAPTAMTRALGAAQYTTAVVAVFVPLAAGIYLVVTVTWTLLQRLVLRRRYPLDAAARA